MADSVETPIRISANAGLLDSLQSAGRSIVFLVGVVTAVLAFVRARDVAGLAAYVQNNIGQIVSAVFGLIGLAAAAYGAYKARKRGAQVATLAPLVPDSVAQIK